MLRGVPVSWGIYQNETGEPTGEPSLASRASPTAPEQQLVKSMPWALRSSTSAPKVRGASGWLLGVLGSFWRLRWSTTTGMKYTKCN